MCITAVPSHVGKTQILCLVDPGVSSTIVYKTEIQTEGGAGQSNMLILPIRNPGLASEPKLFVVKDELFRVMGRMTDPPSRGFGMMSTSFGSTAKCPKYERVGNWNTWFCSHLSTLLEVPVLSAYTAEEMKKIYDPDNTSFIIASFDASYNDMQVFEPLGYRMSHTAGEPILIPTMHLHGPGHEDGGYADWDHTIYVASDKGVGFNYSKSAVIVGASLGLEVATAPLLWSRVQSEYHRNELAEHLAPAGRVPLPLNGARISIVGRAGNGDLMLSPI